MSFVNSGSESQACVKSPFSSVNKKQFLIDSDPNLHPMPWLYVLFLATLWVASATVQGMSLPHDSLTWSKDRLIEISFFATNITTFFFFFCK